MLHRLLGDYQMSMAGLSSAAHPIKRRSNAIGSRRSWIDGGVAGREAHDCIFGSVWHPLVPTHGCGLWPNEMISVVIREPATGSQRDPVEMQEQEGESVEI